MTNKYKLPLTVILIFLIVTLMLCVGYYIHKQNVINNSAEVIIDEELSINYLNERKINSNDKEIKINFSIINDSDDEIMYHINLEDISLEGKNITYTLSENNNSLIKSEELAGGKNITVSSFINISGNNKTLLGLFSTLPPYIIITLSKGRFSSVRHLFISILLKILVSTGTFV